MTLFVVFSIAAVLTFLILLIPNAIVTPPVRDEMIIAPSGRHPRKEGVIVVAAIVIATIAGLQFQKWYRPATTATSMEMGLHVLLATVGLYGLLLVRSLLNLRAVVADIYLLMIATAVVTIVDVPDTLEILNVPFMEHPISVSHWSAPLAVFWVWLVSRATAALNRTPQVTGGYLGLVGLSLMLAYRLGPQNARPMFFPLDATAAIAGAGLATVAVALRRPNFSMGWAASCALGFLLAHITIIGLFKGIAFALLLPLLLLFGLPLLDVWFVMLRASQHGDKTAWEKRRVRLHEALLERGISRSKIVFLYLAIAGYCCCLSLLMVALAHWPLVARFAILIPLAAAGFVLFFSITRVLMRRGPNEQVPEDIEAFGVRLSPVTMKEAMDRIEGFIVDGRPHHVVTSDANSILRAQEDEEYANIVRRAALITPDGYGVMWGARLLNLPIYERVTGVDMVTGICERAAANGYSIYILGAAPGVAAKAAEKLAERYPGMKVAGTQHGFFKPEEEQAVVEAIRDAKPHVLFVAFGIPKQEKFIAKHAETMQVPVSLGVGGSFDVYSENLKRAPEYIQRSGMEWLYRVWQEPWRWKRMSYVPRFMAFALREWIFGAQARKTRRSSAKQAV